MSDFFFSEKEKVRHEKENAKGACAAPLESLRDSGDTGVAFKANFAVAEVVAIQTVQINL